MKSSKESAPLLAQVAYKLGDITYVPHYRNSSVYIGPGYPRVDKSRYSAEQLMLKGAIAVTEILWTRGNHGIVTDTNP
jgi:hypothetical protein